MPNEIPMTIYYRDAERKLHVFRDEAPIEDLFEVRDAVIRELEDNEESFLEPVLVLIQGGKA